MGSLAHNIAQPGHIYPLLLLTRYKSFVQYKSKRKNTGTLRIGAREQKEKTPPRIGNREQKEKERQEKIEKEKQEKLEKEKEEKEEKERNARINRQLELAKVLKDPEGLKLFRDCIILLYVVCICNLPLIV